MTEFRDRTGRRNLESVRRLLQRRPAEMLKIDQRVGRELRLGKQPRSAGEPGIAVSPMVELARSSRLLYFLMH